MDVDEILRRVSDLSTEDKKEVEKCFECYKQFFLLRYRLAGTNENAINFCDQVMMLLVGKMMNFIRDVPQPVQEWDTKKCCLCPHFQLTWDEWKINYYHFGTIFGLFWANFDF